MYDLIVCRSNLFWFQKQWKLHDDRYQRDVYANLLLARGVKQKLELHDLLLHAQIETCTRLQLRYIHRIVLYVRILRRKLILNSFTDLFLILLLMKHARPINK